MGPTTIYGLLDPRDGQLRYIGKTIDLPRRLLAHLGRTNLTPKRHSSCWLIGLSRDGLKPIPIVLETVPHGGDWQKAERRWIAHYRQQGARLTNLADGGEGVTGYVFPAERREYLSKKFSGRVFDDEWRRRISEAKRGKACPQSPEAAAKRIAAIRRAYKERSPRSHCKRGHELSSVGVYVNPSGYPYCRACKRQKALEDYHRGKRKAS
jgi:hypothetical protein